MSMNVNISRGGDSLTPIVYNTVSAEDTGTAVELNPATSKVFFRSLATVGDVYVTFGTSEANAIANLDIAGGIKGVLLITATNSANTILLDVPKGATHYAVYNSVGSMSVSVTEGI